MKPIRIFDVLARRRLLIAGVAIALIIAASVSFALFQRTKKAQAVEFVATADSLVVPENSILYIGTWGYVSQRFFSKEAEPYNASHFIVSNGAIIPPYRVWQTNWSFGPCPDPAVWGDISYSKLCRLFISDGAGMILKYNRSIDIYGTVVIGDRVVFDAPNITLHPGSKIFANGQDGQLGFGDHCGAAGVGGQNGGVNTTTTNLVGEHPGDAPAGEFILPCNANMDGVGPVNQYFVVGGLLNALQAISDPVEQYFIINGTTINGGDGQPGGHAIQGGAHYGGSGVGTIGAGGGGGSGASGSTSGDDHGNSGGAAGGFGLVFKSASLNIYDSAKVNASGGNTIISTQGNPQTPGHGRNATGGFGGVGGGGVIIINSLSVNFFAAGTSTPTAVPANYSLFNIDAGKFEPSAQFPQFDFRFAPGYQADSGGYFFKPSDGKLILNIGNGIASVKKTVTNLGSGDGQLRPNYVFRAGDTVQVKLDVTNLVIGQPVEIRDEIFSDAVNTATVSIPIADGGVIDGSSVVWSFTANTNVKTLTYTMKVN